jgi:hypothetical protein
MKRILFSIFLLFAGNMLLRAQFVADTTLNTRVHDLPGSAQSTPLTATNETGRTFVSWFDNSSGQYTMRMQLLDSLGQKMWPDTGILVSNYPQSSGLFRYDLISDHEGNAIVAFQDERSGGLQVVAYKVNALGGMVWGNAGITLSDSTSNGLAPVLTVLENNDVLVAWTASGNPSGKWVPVKKLRASDGQVLWSNRIAAEGKKFSRPSMLPASSSSFYMLYVKESGNFPGLTSIMYAQKFSSETMQALWQDTLQVTSKNIPFFYFPKIEPDGLNGFFLVFNTGNPANPMLNDAFAQHVDSAGSTWTDEGIQISMDASGNKYNGGYCWVPSDSSLCIALRIQDGNQTMSGISFQKINMAGERVMGENGLELRAMNTELYNPWLLLNSGDGLVCLYGFGSGFNNQKIKGLKIDYDGQALWSYDPVASASASNKDDLSAGPFRNGQTVLVWSEDRSGDDGIYAQNLRLDGHFGNGEVTAVHAKGSSAKPVIFPNPGTKSTLFFTATQSGIIPYRIYDALGMLAETGELFCKQGENHHSVGRTLKPGFYLTDFILGNKPCRLSLIRN